MHRVCVVSTTLLVISCSGSEPESCQGRFQHRFLSGGKVPGVAVNTGGEDGRGEVGLTGVGDLLSCRLGRTLLKPLAAREEVAASPFLRASVAL